MATYTNTEIDEDEVIALIQSGWMPIRVTVDTVGQKRIKVNILAKTRREAEERAMNMAHVDRPAGSPGGFRVTSAPMYAGCNHG